MTGVKAVEKRGGGGKANWGTAEDELAAATEQLNVDDEGKDDQQNGNSEAALREEERKLTLRDFKARQQEEVAEHFDVRKVDMPANMVPMHNKLDESHEEEEIVVQQRPSKKHVSDSACPFPFAAPPICAAYQHQCAIRRRGQRAWRSWSWWHFCARRWQLRGAWPWSWQLRGPRWTW